MVLYQRQPPVIIIYVAGSFTVGIRHTRHAHLWQISIGGDQYVFGGKGISNGSQPVLNIRRAGQRVWQSDQSTAQPAGHIAVIRTFYPCHRILVAVRPQVSILQAILTCLLGYKQPVSIIRTPQVGRERAFPLKAISAAVVSAR